MITGLSVPRRLTPAARITRTNGIRWASTAGIYIAMGDVRLPGQATGTDRADRPELAGTEVRPDGSGIESTAPTPATFTTRRGFEPVP